ncbi:MAG: decaprenyl-phosphate phosphoribosyltransferase [Candidatus Pacebacteria bacterium]|nr:decaprenyl-phosphate phosphoribosyltransferase [Candidatus Paceibacterota bacterium]
MKILYYLLRSARPRQWLKNLAVYTPLIFSGFFFYNPTEAPPYFAQVSFAFVIFCTLASSIYLINDIIDVEADRSHPYKKQRPIASGKLPIPVATFVAVAGLLTVFLLSLSLSNFFKLLLLSYLILQVLYSTTFKHIPIIDVISIATGFLIRVYAGAALVNLHTNSWFLLTVVSASLFLAVGKRQSERTLLRDQKLGKTRKSLTKYSQRLLDVYTGMFANATWLTYAIYAFQYTNFHPEPAHERFVGFYSILPRTFQSQKLLMLTIPFVIFGVMRYLQLVYEENRGESPERVLLNDRPMLIDALLYIILTMMVIYLPSN